MAYARRERAEPRVAYYPRRVVGWANATPDLAQLWECTEDCDILGNWTLTDLNALDVIGRCSDSWTIKRAYDVNDSGVIIASGFRGQGRHALLLTPDPACCPADLDGDGTVGASDQLALLVAWGPCPNCGDCGVECVADLDCDCTVGSVDLNILLLAWGPCDGGSSHHDLDALEQAVQEMGYDDVEDYHEWLAQASEAEALASGWVLYTILQDEE